jgi:DNA/RNA-binding domain of Phe-tRNA-synthetase-like protein
MDRAPNLVIDPSLAPSPVHPALVWGFGMAGCPPSSSMPPFLAELLERVRASGRDFLANARKAAVRDMLRHGAFKPAGRGKPSSEYLLAAALAGEFPLVNGPVDVNNAVSLESGYPASVFDVELSGLELLMRRGKPGEEYPFNPSGQSIDLEDLLCVCRGEDGAWMPCGNPVKDAMATKVNAGTKNVVAVVYAPFSDPPGELEAAAARFSSLLESHCGAVSTGYSA